jgi:hypothetical protein
LSEWINLEESSNFMEVANAMVAGITTDGILQSEANDASEISLSIERQSLAVRNLKALKGSKDAIAVEVGLNLTRNCHNLTRIFTPGGGVTPPQGTIQGVGWCRLSAIRPSLVYSTVREDEHAPVLLGTPKVNPKIFYPKNVTT